VLKINPAKNPPRQDDGINCGIFCLEVSFINIYLRSSSHALNYFVVLFAVCNPLPEMRLASPATPCGQEDTQRIPGEKSEPVT
jgi:hypothetical protein